MDKEGGTPALSLTVNLYESDARSNWLKFQGGAFYIPLLFPAEGSAEPDWLPGRVGHFYWLRSYFDVPRPLSEVLRLAGLRKSARRVVNGPANQRRRRQREAVTKG